MNTPRILGIVLLAIGALLLFFGYNASQSTVSQASEALTGQYTDRTMWYLIGGAGAAVTGALLAVFGNKVQA